MGEMHPPTAADIAYVAGDSAKAETKRLREELDSMYETVRAHIPAEPNLRDMFAAQALGPIISNIGTFHPKAAASQAYAFADAMMAERKKNAG